MHLDLDAVRARNQARKAGTLEARVPCEWDVDALVDALAAAHRELDQLREQNADLEASSALWSRLYEQNVQRANTAEQRLAVSGSPSAQEYYRARDKVDVLAEALASLLEDCPTCHLAESGPATDSEDAERCTRCARAIDALGAVRRAR